jgi:equilibrative nucleoside transporter 1/2/3
MWAYYSCLTAQNYYIEKFSSSQYDFSFLTTVYTSWPMCLGHLLQIVTGMDKKFSQKQRVAVGYSIFIVCSALILLFSIIEFSNQDTGALLVLLMMGCIGFGNSLSEASFYALAALFPMEKYTNAVQIGNVVAGILNVVIATVLRLIVGGVKQTKSATALAFYLFFSLLILVLITALFLYKKLTRLTCIHYLLVRNDAATRDHNLALNPKVNIANLFRVFRIIWVPAITQFLIFFVTLAVFPGFGCAASRNLTPRYTDTVYDYAGLWYCSPGIIGSFNFGDFAGRLLTTSVVYRLVSMKLSLGLALLRVAYIPIMLMGVAGTSVYVFGSHVEAALVWNIVVNFTIGLSTGLLSTVTMGAAPRLCSPDDRETAGAVMVFFLFLGIATGSLFGYDVSTNDWLGL